MNIQRDVLRSVLLAALFHALPFGANVGLAQRAPGDIVGCYQLKLGKWSPGVGGNAAYHALPQSVALDSVPIDSDPAWRLAPNINYPHPPRSGFWGYPQWSVKKNRLHLVWSSGFMVTSAELKRDGDGWKGKARAKSDYVTFWSLIRPPRASIKLQRVTCA